MDQTFAFSDIPIVLTLAFIEILLSADNAIVLGLISHTLPAPLRKKALLIGLISALFSRLIIIIALSFLFGSTWIQLLGGLYLLYLSIHFFTKKDRQILSPKPTSFWKTVVTIEGLDLVFAIDSIVAGIAFIKGDLSKIWMVYFGGLIGIVFIRFAANLFASLLQRFPHLERSAYLMVAWIGIHLGLEAFHTSIPPYIFWPIIIILFLFGFFGKKG